MSHPPTGSSGAMPPGDGPYPPAGGHPAPAGPAQYDHPPAPGPGGPDVPTPGLADTAVAPAYPGAQLPAPPFGQPMSAPPFGQPMSAPPGSGIPYGVAQTGANGGGRGRTVLVLGIVSGLLFVLGGLMTGLFVAKASELAETERVLTAQVAERDNRIKANNEEIEQLKRDLQGARDQIKAIEQDLTGTRNDRDEQERQKQIIARCLDLLGRALVTSNAKDLKEAEQACKEAEKYL